MSNTRLLVLHAITPIHVGTGRGEGVIDLPVARDSVTEHPIIPGSGIKGPLRAATEKYTGLDQKETFKMFGPDTEDASKYQSALRFSDARLIALPVPSDAGTFAWVTSPLVLARLVRDVDGLIKLPDDVPKVSAKEALTAKEAIVLTSDTQRVVLDGVSYRPGPLKPEWLDALAKLAFPKDEVWQNMFRERLVLLPDDTFDELARTGTDVRAHIRINNKTGTVDKGALWYEESVPAESIFVSVVQAIDNGEIEPVAALSQLAEVVDDESLTFGGSKSTGMGRMRAHLIGGAQ